jgi:hypothetical protein
MADTKVMQNAGKPPISENSKENFQGKVYTPTEVPSETDTAASNCRKSNRATSN